MIANAAQILEQRFRQSRDDILLSAVDGRHFSYGLFWANAARLAETWHKEGARPGDSIALILPNDAAYPCCYLACAIGGFIACPIIPDLLPAKIDYLLSLIHPALVLREPPELDAGLAAPDPDKIVVKSDPEETCVIIFTSGTTGNPKGICHRLSTVVGVAMSFGKLSGMGPGTRLYHVLPMAYNAGFLNTLMAPMLAGGRIVLGPGFSPVSALDFWRRPADEDANFLILTPTMAAALCRLTRDRDAARKAAVRFTRIQTTAGQLTNGLRRQFLEVFGRPLQDCYGVTELGGPLTTQTPEDAMFEEDVGRPLPELKITFRPGPNGKKEMWIRSPFVMKGYLTEGGIEPPTLSDGYMATGDLALLKNGKLCITGRCKDLIVRGGINVSPIAVENAISVMEDVADVAVVGAQHEFWGEIIVACVIPRPDVDPVDLKRRIRRHNDKNLSQNDRPDRILVMHEFPRATTGKVQKNLLRQYAAACLND